MRTPVSPVASAFDGARDYDRHARVQRQVAVRLARDIADTVPKSGVRVLEIGCGTGFLTQALCESGGVESLLATDIAPAMLDRCRERMRGDSRLCFALLDGECGRPPDGGGYGLICSSLAFQWFADPAGAIARIASWLAPGGSLIFTSLLSATFAEWRAAHEAVGLRAGLRVLPGRALFDGLLPEMQVMPHRVDRLIEPHGNALSFLRSLRAIGADTAEPGHAPLGPAAMRRVMRRFEAGGARVSYEVITCHYRRSD
ncbi:MAG: methyltransferase domain-containing protein [Novosphingobium sp.]|nr:methyltransferase domain-containing protein [Novosphingobium sp.]